MNKIAAVLTVATVLGLAVPASAQVVYGGGWSGGPYRHYGAYNSYNFYPRHHFFVAPRRHVFVVPRRRFYGGGGYQPSNRPSPTDHVARELNRRQLYGGGY